MKNRKLILLVAPILFFTSTLSAQESTAKIYRSQYAQLREKVIALMTRAQNPSVDRIALLDEQEVMLKLTRRLEGQAMDDFLSSYERGPDKSLLLVVHACDAIFLVSLKSPPPCRPDGGKPNRDATTRAVPPRVCLSARTQTQKHKDTKKADFFVD